MVWQETVKQLAKLKDVVQKGIAVAKLKNVLHEGSFVEKIKELFQKRDKVR